MDDNLTVGELFTGTIDTLQENGRTAGLYVGVLTTVGTAIEWGLGTALAGSEPLMSLPDSLQTLLGVGAGIGGLLVIILAIVAQYLLWEAMLDNGTLFARPQQGRRYLAFVGLAILTALGVGLGFMLLIIPGLLFNARWMAAPAFLIRQRTGITESMRLSWDGIKGNSKPVILVYIVGVIVVMVMAGMVGAGSLATAGFAGGPQFFTVLAGQLVSNFGTVLQVGLGVYLFRRITGNADDIGTVFD